MDQAQLVEALNADLASEFAAIIQYLTYAAKVSGPDRPELSRFFLAEVADEQGHALFLANKIVALGGEPTNRPTPIPAAATNEEMLEAIVQAEQYGDKGLQVQLEDMVRDETSHLEEVKRILGRG